MASFSTAFFAPIDAYDPADCRDHFAAAARRPCVCSIAASKPSASPRVEASPLRASRRLSAIVAAES